ncbi:hypothetical protein [Paenibacillus durus]|uniref:hypothetical protein n=1 Tax=Paenibacillus durus TaxID=44251 RepID=UPI000ADAFA10|nr:hypothetical protein [Paenibacillus durus]
MSDPVDYTKYAATSFSFAAFHRRCIGLAPHFRCPGVAAIWRWYLGALAAIGVQLYQ